MNNIDKCQYPFVLSICQKFAERSNLQQLFPEPPSNFACSGAFNGFQTFVVSLRVATIDCPFGSTNISIFFPSPSHPVHPPGSCSVELMLGDKRSNGMLDFGLARGMSGVDAAKARLGLKYANDPYGPGRR